MELHRLQAQYCKALRRRIVATINISVDDDDIKEDDHNE